MNRTVDAAVARLAHRQHLVVSRRQVHELGASEALVGRRLAAGSWVRVAPSVYGLPGAPGSFRRDLMAACLDLGAVASHEAAAELHDLGYVPRGHVVVTVPADASRRSQLARVHRRPDLRDADRAVVDGVPCTTVARTLVDLAAVLRPARLDRVVDDALTARRVTLDDLDDAFGAVARRGRPGVAAMRAVLADKGPGYVAPESELEARLLRVVADFGLPEPVRQAHLPFLPRAGGRADLAWPHARVVAEADGRRWHQRDLEADDDAERDNAVQLAGWVILRFRWRRVTREPERVAAAIRSALSRRAGVAAP